MSSDEMVCQELVGVVSDYLEGRLAERDRARFEHHLDECSYCVEYLDQMRRTVAAVGRLAEDDLTPAERRELLRLFRGWRGEPC